MIARQSLLDEIESLPHSGRRLRMVELGRATGRNAAAAALVTELATSPEAWERLLALYTFCGSGEGELVVAALEDISRPVRRVAATLLADVRDPELVARALAADHPPRLLRRAFKALHRRRRRGLLDRILEARLELKPEPWVVDQLSLGSAGLVERWLPIVVEEWSFDWKPLVRRHPESLAAFLASRIIAVENPDWRWIELYRAWSSELARRAPAVSLELLSECRRRKELLLHLSALKQLARQRPREVIELVQGEGGDVGRAGSASEFLSWIDFSPAAHRLGSEALTFLVQNAPGSLDDGAGGPIWFERLAPNDRESVLAAFLGKGADRWGGFLLRYLPREGPGAEDRENAFARWCMAHRDHQGNIRCLVLEALPRDLREREARRHLARPAVLAGHPPEGLAYARLLSFTEARQCLELFFQHPDPNLRAEAARELLATLREDPGSLREALAWAATRKSEPTRVWRSILEPFSRLPASAFSPEDLPTIAEILRQALAAGGQVEEAERWMAQLSRVDAGFAEEGLLAVYAAGGLSQRCYTWLTPAQASRLGDRIVAAKSEKSWVFEWIWLARALGPGLANASRVLERLEEDLLQSPDWDVGEAALQLLGQHAPRRFEEVAEGLVRARQVECCHIPVVDWIGKRRHDLLPLLLEAASLNGKGLWISGELIGISDFPRFSPRQQQAIAAILPAMSGEEPRLVLEANLALRLRLPWCDPEPVIRLAKSGSEAAIGGLARLEGPLRIELLLGMLSDDHATSGLEAWRTIFDEVPKAQIFDALRSASLSLDLETRIPRVLGLCDDAEAHEELLRWQGRCVHRDLEIAWMQALWPYLEDPRTWRVFENIAGDPFWTVAIRLVDLADAFLYRRHDELAARLLARLLERPEAALRRQLLDRARDLKLPDRSRTFFRALVAQLAAADLEEATVAFAAVVVRMHPDEVDEVAAAFAGLDRRHLEALTRMWNDAPFDYRETHPKLLLAERLLPRLEADPALAPHFVRVGGAYWDFREMAANFERLADRGWMYHEVFEAALEAVPNADHPDPLEALLRRSSHWQLRRLGLELLVIRASWSAERRELLEIYRNDPAPGVAGPASFVFPPVS